MIKTTASVLFKYAGLIGALVYLIAMNLLNQLPIDAGDGVVHYSIAKASWSEPTYLLDHWGKPLFTLLSSGFAQISFKWHIGFNIIVYALTCLAAFRLFKQLEVAKGYYFFFPILLICVPDYANCVLAGMTETLFGLLIMCAILLAFLQRWMLFAIVVSLAPFARSEGMMVVVAGLFLLAIARQWKSIPFLFTGFIVYGIAGLALLDSFWWYFENNPYPPESIYGSGPWYHYLDTWENHFGLISMVLLPVGLFGSLVLRSRKIVPHFTWIFLFGMGIWLGIIVIHSYFWAYGLRGSAGLTRIATLGLPVAMVLITIGCHFVTKELNTIPHILGGLIVSLLCVKEIRELPYPLHANAFEKILIQSADYIGKEHPNGDIYYYHPLIAWRLNVGIKDNPSRFKQMCFSNDPHTIDDLKPGTIIVRDPQFGPVEHGLNQPTMDSLSKTLVRIKTFRATEPYEVYTGEPVEVVIYKVAP
ncbi:MAG TPA: hypothetical protein VK151_15075 [Fluviicola sp.]|nr:hypothetical protein [Fluviicola sp.]